MKKLENPTTFFFKQAQSTTTEHNEQIQKFISRLINIQICELCKQNYDISDHIPRIMIHCGHTFCGSCLNKFFMNRRVRCPMCLKLVKYIDSIQRLPINHSIYHHLIEKENQKLIQQGKNNQLMDAAKLLYSEFQRVQKQAHIMQNPQKIDPQSGLPFCVFHGDRVQHFFCQNHSYSGCRVCIQVGHSKPQCTILDLYNVQDPQKYLHPHQQRIQQPDMSQPFINSQQNNMLGLNQDDEDLVQDDSDEEGDDESSQEVGRRSL